MKKVLLMLVLIVLIADTSVLAIGEFDAIETAISEYHKPEMKVRVAGFILANRDVSQKDAKRMKVLDRACDITMYNIAKKYNASPENYQTAISNKKDRELYETTLELSKRKTYRAYLLCKGSLNAAIDAAKKSSELRRKTSNLDRNSSNAIEINEQLLNSCIYDDAVIWELLPAYRYNHDREKYNNLMLRIVREDQVVFNYSTGPSDEISSVFRNEFLSFLSDVNSLNDRVILSKEQVGFVVEAILAKYRGAFTLQDVASVEDAYYIVQPLVVALGLLEHYKLDDLRNKLIDAFFTNDLAMETLTVYARNSAEFTEALNSARQRASKK